MKIKLLDRILLTLYTIVILLVSLLILGLSFGLINIQEIRNFVLPLSYDLPFVLITLAIGGLLFIISLKLLFAGLVESKPKSSMLKITDMGSITVSLIALDNLVQKAVRSFDEVKDVSSRIASEPDGIRLTLRIIIMPDVKIPELTTNIQARVKEYVEDLSGIAVKEVMVNVENLFNSQRSKVQ